MGRIVIVSLIFFACIVFFPVLENLLLDDNLPRQKIIPSSLQPSERKHQQGAGPSLHSPGPKLNLRCMGRRHVSGHVQHSGNDQWRMRIGICNDKLQLSFVKELVLALGRQEDICTIIPRDEVTGVVDGQNFPGLDGFNRIGLAWLLKNLAWTSFD